MTHQNHQTNGASLEDCHTNFFALTDLCGIKWRKFLFGERPNASGGEPLDDPILQSYTECLSKDILCVWRRVAAPKQEPDPNATIPYDIVSTHTHPPLALTAAKELWIFWYGDEPNFQDLVDPRLIESSDANAQGAWESGLSYECRSLLFKALHNLIERCLLSRDIIRLGKWFVQPCAPKDQAFSKSSHHLSFSFAFFVHGESTVCASMDLREHPAVRPLCSEHLAEAAAAAAASQTNGDARPKPVILAPYGLAATLTGNSYKSSDPTTEKLLRDWNCFYPVCNKENSELPPIVEIITGGVKMRYPSKYVLVTDLDNVSDNCMKEELPTTKSLQLNQLEQQPAYSIPNYFSHQQQQRHQLELAYIHNPPSIATLLPESVWQDCIMNPVASSANCNLGQSASSGNSGGNNNSGINNNIWNFTDPTQKSTCTCTKCRKSNGGKRTGSTSSGMTSSTSSNSSGKSSSASGSRSEKVSSRINRIPFHRRQTHNSANQLPQRLSQGNLAAASSSTSSSLKHSEMDVADNKGLLQSAVSSGHSVAEVGGESSAGDIGASFDSISSQRSTNIGTPQGGGASSYSRNPHSIGESMPVPSVGSPSSAGPSPHPNSAQSQPTSVPPADQLLAASPRPPTSVPAIQPMTPVDHLDKNTPAPTPTDQHDSKSVTASPYVQQNPSVEPPPSAEGISCPGSVGAVKKVEPGLTSVSGHERRGNNSTGNIASSAAFMALLKRPHLATNDIESSNEEEAAPYLLYDFSTLDAWMDHPIKIFKRSDDVKIRRRHICLEEMYKQQTHVQPPLYSPSSILFGAGMACGKDMSKDQHILDMCGSIKTEEPCTMQNETKKEIEEVKEKNNSNLYTSEGLQPSYEDLEQLFDNSDDNSNDDTLQLQVPTPPGSNKSSGCGMEEIKKSLNTNSSSIGPLRPEELSHMFPTPPSHEHHPNSSPCSGGITDIQMTDIIEMARVKQEIYVDLGSPPGEPIRDWSYVFIPPVTYTFVGSSKYAPLTNLPSQSMPPITIPPNLSYKPSVRPPPQRQQQDQSLQQMQLQQQLHQHHNMPNNVGSILAGDNNPSSLGLGLMEREKQLPPMFSGNPLQRPPSAPILNYGGTPVSLQQQMAVRAAGMSPISPAAGPQMGGFPGGSPMSHPVNSFRRTPVPPPPPYELAVSSPDTSTSSYLNKQFNSQEPPTPSSAIARTPEANSLLVNVLLYDTELNIFRDHNFDSCTLCVCNADGPKCVGNIRGADSGIYVSLPGTTFNPATGSAILPAGLSQPNAIGAGSGGNSIRSISAFGGMDSPSFIGSVAMGSQHQTGYVDDDPITCRCGFSAVVNRRLAYRSGLFYEDEMEITGMAEDPGFYKKKTIHSILVHSGCINNDENANNSAITQTIMDMLRDQCTIIQSSSSSIQRVIARYKRRTATSEMIRKLNILEFADANDVICLAIEQGRLAYEASIGMANRMDLEPYRLQKLNISVHKWPFVMADGTRNNQDIIRMMQSMQPLLQNAFHSKNRKRWEATYFVKGPLTWRQFHMLAGRGVGQCEPQPIPSLIVGHEKDWLSVAPYAVHYWDKLMLEPYSYPRDVVYLVISPEDDYIVKKIRSFFKELSTTYEMCKLGRHTPIKGWDGILQVGCRSNRDMAMSVNEHSVSSDENSQTCAPENRFVEQLKLYTSAFQSMLVPYLSRIPSDKSLLDPPKDLNSNVNKDRPLPSPMPPPSTPDSQSQSSDKAPSTPKCENEAEAQRDNMNTSTTTTTPVIEPLSGNDDDINPPVIVIYVIDPFTIGSDSPDLQRAACLSLLKCYSELLTTVPESIRHNINFQIISLESVLELGRNRSRLRFSDEMRALALSVFSQCRRFLTHTAKVKSLTGFGTAANMELFLKSKDEKNRATYKMYTPPYILAPVHEKSDKTDTFRLKNIEQQYSVLYCNYCLSEDQSWLLASATDERGELMETITINIEIPNIRRRRHAPARRLGLKKLMDFILGIVSRTVQPWRLVIGRIGRIGHGELKSWSWLLSKQNLQKLSKELKDLCKQCSIMSPHQVPSILSACLVTLEPDSNFRVMPDQFTPDERFSQISMQNPLSTPQDVTCTHILVFPTSAVSQSYQRAFNEQHINGLENDDMIFDFGEEEDQIGDVNSMGDIFDWAAEVPMQQSPERNSNHGSPGCMEDNRSRQSPGNGGNNFNSMRNIHDAQDMEEVGTVLQQPLALGYLVSTAPTGPMPPWFWASCPHMENVCPVFLKTALHIHVASIQQSSDDPLLQNHSSATDHPLDASLTADVLRYVLEGYNVLSWLAMDSNTHDRLSCLPINVQVLMQLYHMAASMA